jgi:two-component system, sensor histidine kinase ChiS
MAINFQKTNPSFAEIILLLLFFIIITPCISAQQDKMGIKFDNISIKDGLSQSSPNCIFQDSRGILWIGTEDGLNKYDGYAFTVYKPDQKDPNSISNPRIFSICEDARGNLWIGTNGGGLNEYDRKTDRFIHFLPSNQDSASIAGSLVYTVAKAAGNKIWIGTDKGLSIFDLKSNRFADVKHDPILEPLTRTTILSIALDTANTWIGTDIGLFQVEKAGTLKSYSNAPGISQSLPGKLVTSLLIDKNHNLWVGTENGPAELKPGNENFEVFTDLSGNGLQSASDHVRALLEDDQGNIWIGTFGGGLHIYNASTGDFMHLAYDYNNPYSLSNNEVLSLFMDLSGIIWVGTNGLDKYNPKKDKFVLYDYVPYVREKLIFRNIHPIYEDTRGILWVGSKSDGLHILDRRNKKYSRLVHEPGNPNSLSSSRIRTLLEYPEGTLWIGTEDQGLNKMILNAERKPTRYSFFRNIPGNPNSLTSNKIYAIYPDKKGKLWIGTDKGLTIMEMATESFTQFIPDTNNPKSLSNSTVYCIYGDQSEGIWLATDFGVNKFDPASGGFIHYIHNDKDTASLIHNEILSFLEDKQGNLWIGTYGKGLDKFNPKNQTFTHYTAIKSLSTAVIYGILEDNNENLWLSTNNGIIKFNPARGEINQFSIEDGLQSNEFNGTSYFKSFTGEMFFGGQYGFNSFFPNAVVKDSVPPKIIMSGLQVGNKSVVPGSHSPIDQHISEVKEIHLNYRQNNFTLYFSALHFANPAQNKYKYKLEGFDEDWIDAGNRRFVSYTSLPYKTYTFRVIASNSDGIWNEKGLSVKIKIRPPFWATIWFRIFMFLVICSAVYYGVRKRLSFEKKQKLVFENKFQASSKELQEAREKLELQHDEIVVQKRELKLREKDQENLLWFNQGLGLFSDLISRNKDDLTLLCRIFIQKLVEYVEAQQGGVFLINDDQEEESFLELIAHFAFSEERTHRQFMPGEGYVGACFTSKEFMEIDNVTENYTEISSGLGKEYLKYLLFAPLKINDQCIGVIELGSFRKIKGYRVSFVEKLMETFASNINTEKANAKLKKLIEHSTMQSKELAESEEQLRMNLEEIMATQEESARREDELIKLAEESATHEEMLSQEIESLKRRIDELTGQRKDS